MKLNVISLDGGKPGSIELSDEVFGIEQIRADILQRVVVWQLAKRRSGNHAIKLRGDVDRTKKKMYRQKGTGGARHGSRSAAQFVGGAKAFGPVVRSHAFSLPKKVRALALRHALSSKAKDGALVVLDSFAAESGTKTSAFAKRLNDAGVANALVIAGPEVDDAARLASRNIRGLDVLPNAGLNVYDVLRARQLVLTRAAVEAIEARFANDGDAAEQQEAA